MPPSNKRRKIEPTVEEITFDLGAREEFLTGFHKRKVQRAKHAREKAEQRARQDRIDQRKQFREERKAELERHVRTVNEMLRPAGPEVEPSSDEEENLSGIEAEEWNGIRDSRPEPVDHEAEYIDEDKYTTVTIEAMDITKDGLLRAEQDSDSDAREEKPALNDAGPETIPAAKAVSTKRPWSKERPPDQKKKPKKKRNFRYEGRTERKVNRAKEKLKNRKQANARKAG